MLRVAGKKLASLPWMSSRATSTFIAQSPPLGGSSGSSPSDGSVVSGHRSGGSSKSIFSADPLYFSPRLPDLIRGYSSGEDTKLAHNGSRRDSQEDSMKVKNPERFVNGVCAHLGSIPLPKGPAPYQFVSLRQYASPPAEQTSNTPNSLRPLSPHLPVYQPQINSTLSIFNRISGIYLTAFILSFYFLTMKMGSVCLTYESFYQTLFYSSKLFPIAAEISLLALAYHLFSWIRHL
uniref:Succinate dehydrogenase subunit 3 n=1 Tax=Monsonia emarginata TaxID=28966 RepID=A0A0G2YF63_9ROSI|nr:succinate dehydrogenase subunit 3 [Monsonia emarginata]